MVLTAGYLPFDTPLRSEMKISFRFTRFRGIIKISQKNFPVHKTQTYLAFVAKEVKASYPLLVLAGNSSCFLSNTKNQLLRADPDVLRF